MKFDSMVVLVSGRGSNAMALADAVADGRLPVEFRAVIADRRAPALTAAAGRGIDTACIPREAYPERTAFEEVLDRTIGGFDPDLVVLAGFMRVFSAAMVARRRGRMVNIHPSLLPRHRGLQTHAAALAAGDTEHGASIHFVTPQLDSGPVLAQARVPVQAGDTADSLRQRVLAQEHRLYPAALALLHHSPVEYRHDRIHIDDRILDEPLVLDRDLAADGSRSDPGRSRR